MIYFDGNFFGVCFWVVVECVVEVVVVEWGEGFICSWNSVDWCGLLECFGDKLVFLIGVCVGEVVIIDIILINLFKVFSVVLWIQEEDVLGCKVIVFELSNFFIDLYIVEGFIDMFQCGYWLCLVDDLE